MHFHKKILFFIVIFGNLIISLAAHAKSVTAVALFNERAMLLIDGQKPKIVRQGNSYLGVKLISSNTSEAVVEFDGQRQTLTLNGSTVLGSDLAGVSSYSSVDKSIVLYEVQAGFFHTDGLVDGKKVNFLVDTGANIVVLNSFVAERLGIDYKNGRRGFATTASGRAPLYTITVDKIKIGSIELRDIETGVIEGGFPETPLLGMSFLGQLDISKKGNKLTLKK